jgi:hypothetical protein
MPKAWQGKARHGSAGEIVSGDDKSRLGTAQFSPSRLQHIDSPKTMIK